MDKKERYTRGAHTVLDLKYHYVWKTKYSYPVLRENVALRLRDLIKKICEAQGMVVVRENVRANHVHILVRAPSHLSVAKMAQYLKGRTAHQLMKEFPDLKKRYWGSHLWGRGYFCNTVGSVTEEMLKRYIEDQTDEPDAFKVWDEPKDLSSPGDLSSLED